MPQEPSTPPTDSGFYWVRILTGAWIVVMNTTSGVYGPGTDTEVGRSVDEWGPRISPPEWRPVSERAPVGVPLWVAKSGDGEVSKGHASYDDSGLEYDYPGPGIRSRTPFTHWMLREPTPAPPVQP